MPSVDIIDRTVLVRARALLEDVPVMPLPAHMGEGGVVPSVVTVTYSCPPGGASWSVEVMVQGVRTHPRPGQKGEQSVFLISELASAPDWVEVFVRLNEPHAVMRGPL